MSKETRKNIPEEKKKQRNQYDTSADNILKEEPQGKHFNENVTDRRQSSDHNHASDPDAYLGAEEVDSDRSMSSVDNHSTSITAPEIVEEQSQAEKETLEEFKEDMTGG